MEKNSENRAELVRQIVAKVAAAHGGYLVAFKSKLANSKEAGDALLELKSFTRKKWPEVFDMVREHTGLKVSNGTFERHLRIAKRFGWLEILAGEQLSEMSVSRAYTLLVKPQETSDETPEDTTGQDTTAENPVQAETPKTPPVTETQAEDTDAEEVVEATPTEEKTPEEKPRKLPAVPANLAAIAIEIRSIIILPETDRQAALVQLEAVQAAVNEMRDRLTAPISTAA